MLLCYNFAITLLTECPRVGGLNDSGRLIFFAVQAVQRLITLTAQHEKLTAADRRLNISQA